ncbi:MAG: 30S ribosomal protein S6 [Deltaproteobacteria bacterium]|nr:30S ribosomal protein S6 [Deltaproteobacteria bacterium]
MSGLSRKYEMIYIHPGNLPGEDVEQVEEILNGTLAKMGGELIHREDWGVRTLAYQVRKHNEGRYILVRFACTADCLNEIERRFRINESVIKYLSVRLPDDFVQEEVVEETEEEVAQEAPKAAAEESAPAPAAAEAEAEAPAAEQQPAEENPGE